MDGTLRTGCLGRWTIVVLAALAPGLWISAAPASEAAGGGSRAEGLSGSTFKLAAAHASASAKSHKPAPCYQQIATAGGVVRFSSRAGATRASFSLDVHHYKRSILIGQASACAPTVLAGHTYKATVHYRSSVRALSLEVLKFSGHKWHSWYVAAKGLKTKSFMGSYSVVLRPVQAGVSKLDLALLITSKGSLHASGFSLVDVTKAASGAGKTPTPATPAPTEGEPTYTGLAATGSWSVIPGDVEEARSIHAVLLQNGKLLIMAGSGNDKMEFEKGSFKSFIYDPVANTWKYIPTPYDVFCSGHVQLANGNVLIMGGTKEYPAPPEAGHLPSTEFKGENASAIFNIRTEAYEVLHTKNGEFHQEAEPGPLLNGAWYPSATELGNGDVISFGGLNEKGKGSTDTNYFTGPGNEGTDGDQTEEWVGFASSKLQQTYDWFWGLYPSMILTADGRLFYDGSHVFGLGTNSEEKSPAPDGSSIYDFYCTPGKSKAEEEAEQTATNPNAQVVGPNGTFPRVVNTPGLREPNNRDQSASLLLPPAQSQKVMIMGGGETYSANQDAINLTDEINLKEANPHWVAGPNLPRGKMENGSMEPANAGKMYDSAVALPDGNVLETGGSLLPRRENVLESSIFDPTTNAFTSVAADPVGRDYHSEALLLPDGRVLALGSNPANIKTGEESFETRISIYEPPYLFRGARPVINTLSGPLNPTEPNLTQTEQWEYGESQTLGYSSSLPITSAVLIRPAAVTHSSDPNQREVTLPIEKDQGGQLTVSLTSNPNLAPPGYYMVFLVNSHGVPSVARWVHVGPQGA
jgi:hypothetical protein